MTKGFVALILVAALLGGGISHATVSHEHGHSHDASESSIWATLHASLRHEDKQALFMLAESFSLVVLAVLALALATSGRYVVADFNASLRDPLTREALRRGIFRYRVFV